MTIDSLYDKMDKNNYYIGRISQVYRDNSIAQVENLTLCSLTKNSGVDIPRHTPLS